MPPQSSPSANALQWQESRVSDEDKTKALDAIIVAIGIVSVLITNVAYVGYLTTPGGPDPYWLDCDYPMFTAYIYFNGFAMVFSTAAIAVVTFGPFVLIRRELASWRKQIVEVGLWYLGFSLITLLAAFACAGFVVALVAPPPLNCANIKCGDGGIRCVLDGRSPSLTSTIFMNSDFGLDPQVEYLNQDVLFGPNSNRSLETHGSITCCSYPFIQISNESDPCFALTSSYGVTPVAYVPGSKSMPQRYGYSTWCTSHFTDLFDCDNIPLTFGDAYDLFNHIYNVDLAWNSTLQPGVEDSNGVPLLQSNLNESNMSARLFYAQHTHETSFTEVHNGTSKRPFCPLQPELAQHFMALPTDGSQSSNKYIALLCDLGRIHEHKSSFCKDPRNGDGSFKRSTDDPIWLTQTEAVRQGCTETDIFSCIVKSVVNGGQYMNDTRGVGTSCDHKVMCDWHNYVRLRYQCSGGPNPTLCDYGYVDDPVEPPLAVDLDKKYMTKKTLADYPDVYIAQGQTTVQVMSGVTVMLVVAFVVNVLSFVMLAGPSYLNNICSTVVERLKRS